jgi:hypothetical protein
VWSFLSGNLQKHTFKAATSNNLQVMALKKSTMAAIIISLTIPMLTTSFPIGAANSNLVTIYSTSTQIQTMKSPDDGNPMVFPLLLIAALIILAAGIAIIYFTRRKNQTVQN